MIVMKFRKTKNNLLDILDDDDILLLMFIVLVFLYYFKRKIHALNEQNSSHKFNNLKIILFSSILIYIFLFF